MYLQWFYDAAVTRDSPDSFAVVKCKADHSYCVGNYEDALNYYIVCQGWFFDSWCHGAVVGHMLCLSMNKWDIPVVVCCTLMFLWKLL